MKRRLAYLLAVVAICSVVIADSGLPFRPKRQQTKKIDQVQPRKLAEKGQFPVDPTDPNGWKMLSLYTGDGHHQKPGEYYRTRTNLEAKDQQYGDISQRVIDRGGKTYVESHEFFMPPSGNPKRHPDD